MNCAACSLCLESAETDSVCGFAACLADSPLSGGSVTHSKSAGACSTICWRSETEPGSIAYLPAKKPGSVSAPLMPSASGEAVFDV